MGGEKLEDNKTTDFFLNWNLTALLNQGELFTTALSRADNIKTQNEQFFGFDIKTIFFLPDIKTYEMSK